MKKVNFNFIFFIAYLLMFFSDFFNRFSRISVLLTTFDIVSIFILLFLFVYFRLYKKKQNIIYISFLIITLISSYRSNNRALIKLAVTLLVCENIKFDKFIEKDFKVKFILIFMMIVLEFAGVFGGDIYEIRNGHARRNFGLEHPNTFAIYLSMLSIELYYLFYIHKEEFKKAYRIIPIVFAILIIFFNYMFLGSRTNIVLVTMVSIIYIFNLSKLKIKIIEKIIPYSFLIFMIISLALTILYPTENSFILWLDNVFSKRIYMSSVILHRYLSSKISFLGTSFDKIDYFILDNAYLNILIRYGILVAIFFTILFVATFKKLIKTNKKFLLLILFAMLVYSLFESPLYIVDKNPFIMLLAMGFKDSWRKNEENT